MLLHRWRLRPGNAVTFLQPPLDYLMAKPAGIHPGEAMRVLLVEDHAKLAMTLATGLRREGMAATSC